MKHVSRSSSSRGPSITTYSETQDCQTLSTTCSQIWGGVEEWTHVSTLKMFDLIQIVSGDTCSRNTNLMSKWDLLLCSCGQKEEKVGKDGEASSSSSRLERDLHLWSSYRSHKSSNDEPNKIVTISNIPSNVPQFGDFL